MDYEVDKLTYDQLQQLKFKIEDEMKSRQLPQGYRDDCQCPGCKRFRQSFMTLEQIEVDNAITP